MKPYFYILAVLLVGGGIGFYIGMKSVTIEQSLTGTQPQLDDKQLLLRLVERQAEAYSLHDELLLLRDCAESYSEVNGTSGLTLDLNKAILFYHEQFREGRSISFSTRNPEVTISKNSALIKSSYSKTSDSYEKIGLKGYAGEGIWLLAKSNGQWQINAFAYVEEAKK
jgi:hypothetical protein